MNKELIGFLPEPGAKPKDDDQRVAGTATLAASIQQQQPPPATFLDCGPVGRGVMAASEGVRSDSVLKEGDSTVGCPMPESERKGRKPPGRRAKEHGTRLKRGQAVQVMVYPRPATKVVLVRAARKHHQALSSFLIRAGLEKAARTPWMRGRGFVTTGRTGTVPLRGKRQRWAGRDARAARLGLTAWNNRVSTIESLP